LPLNSVVVNLLAGLIWGLFSTVVLLTDVAGICRLSLLPAFHIAFLSVSFGKHFTSFTVSALGDISPCFLRLFW
jgi:hypothetical protein